MARAPSHGPSELDELGNVERAAICALEAARATCGDPRMLMRAHLCIAEVRWLQGRKSVSAAHFLECRDLFFGLFMGPDNRFLLRDGPVSFTRSALTVLHRMIRLLITLEPASINRKLEIFDAALQLEADLGLRRHKAKAPATPPTEVGRRIWSLLYCMRCNGRLGATRGLPADDLLRRNLSSLRKIYRFASSSCSSTPRSMGKDKVLDDSPRALGARGEAQPAESFSDSSLNYDGNPQVRAIADRHVYALCILEQLVVVYCPGTGLVEVRTLAASSGNGLLNPGVINLMEGMILGRATSEDDAKKAAEKSKHAPAATFTASSRTVTAGEGIGRSAVESSEVHCMIKAVAGTLLSQRLSASIPVTAERAASAPLPDTVKPKEKLWPKLWSPFARLAMKFHRAPPPIKIKTSAAAALESPLLLACSAVLRVVPWESACPGLLLRTLGVTSCLAAIPAPPAHGALQAGGPQIVSLHSSRWQGKALSQAKLAAARGAMVREWVSGMQVGVWPPPGGVRDEGREAYSAWTCPLHSPLVKPRGLAATRRKYPWVSFLETDSGADVAAQISDSPETLVLLPYSELLRFPVALHSELGQLSSCTVAFCPDVAFKPLVRMLKASLMETQSESDASKAQDMRSALLSATRELNKNLGFPIVVLSHAWRTADGHADDGAGCFPKPAAAAVSAPVDSAPGAAPAILHSDGRFPVPTAGPEHAAAAAAEPAPPSTRPADAVAQNLGGAHFAAPVDQSHAESEADARAKLGDRRAGAYAGSQDGLVHTPLEVEDEATRRAFGLHRTARSRRRDLPPGDRSLDTAFLASQALRPYARSLSAAQAAEHQEASRRLPPHAMASARVRGMRGRVASEMSAAYSPRGESSSGAGPSELSDAHTREWMPETESSGWLTSAEQTPSSTSAEPTPRSAGPPAGEVLAEVISEEEEDWDLEEER